MFGFSGIEDPQQSYRVRYARAMKIKEHLRDEKDRIEMQILENDVALITLKRRLYTCGFSQIHIEKSCHIVSKWLQDVKSGAVKRNDKCEGKEQYKMLCDLIKNDTGIEVKELTDIIFVRHEVCKLEFEFKPLINPKILCRLSVPNFESSYFCASIEDGPIGNEKNKKNYNDIIFDMDTELSVITKRTNWSTELETIARFPNGTPLAEFGDALKAWCLNKDKEADHD